MAKNPFKFTSNSKGHKEMLLKAAEIALTKGILVAQDRAVKLAPVDTGQLRQAIGTEVKSDTAYLFNIVQYAPYVEFGTSKQQAQPFMRPALKDQIVRKTVFDTLKEEMDG